MQCTAAHITSTRRHMWLQVERVFKSPAYTPGTPITGCVSCAGLAYQNHAGLPACVAWGQKPWKQAEILCSVGCRPGAWGLKLEGMEGDGSIGAMLNPRRALTCTH